MFGMVITKVTTKENKMRTNIENFFAAMKQDGFPHESIIQMNNYLKENELHIVTQSTMDEWTKRNLELSQRLIDEKIQSVTFFRYFGDKVFWMSPSSAVKLKKCLDDRLEETIAHEKVTDENWERLQKENEKLKEIIREIRGDLANTWFEKGNEKISKREFDRVCLERNEAHAKIWELRGKLEESHEKDWSQIFPQLKELGRLKEYEEYGIARISELIGEKWKLEKK